MTEGSNALPASSAWQRPAGLTAADLVHLDDAVVTGLG
jgi:hypothetical protein